MKIKILFVIFLLIVAGLFLTQRVIAQEQTDTTDTTDTATTEAVAVDEEINADDLGVSDPTILPDNPLYPAKNLWWKIRTKLTFNPVKKAELQLKIANSKLLEAKKLAQKTGKDEILKQALQNYQGEMDIVQNRIEVLKEKASENPKIDKFLDNYTDKAIKQQRLMARLEQQLTDKPEVLDKIRQNKEKLLEHFGEVIQKLEDKDKIADRLEKNLENAEGSKYKNFKNLEVLLELENKVPEQAKDAIRQAQENALKRLQENLENMSPQDQEKFKDYLEKVSGDQTIHLRILEKLEGKNLPPLLEQKIEQNKEQVQNRVDNLKENLLRLCPEKTSSATIEELKKCIQEKRQTQEQEEEQQEGEEILPKIPCPMLWAPVCGKDGKTYGNPCLAKAAKVEIASRGKCESAQLKTTCRNKCGDSICQEVVCRAIGCPCAETKTTCPNDCK